MEELLRIPIDLLTTGPFWRKAVTVGCLIAVMIVVIVLVTRKRESYDNTICYDARNKAMKCKSSSSLKKSCDETYKVQNMEECQQFADSTDFDKIAGEYKSNDGAMINATFDPEFFRGNLVGEFNDPKNKGLSQIKFNHSFNLYKLTSIDNRMCFGGYIPTIKEANENRVYFFVDGELKIDYLGKSFYKQK